MNKLIRGGCKVLLACVLFAAAAVGAWAQPTIVSVVPANNATGVSTNTNVVFTFSAPMDTNNTSSFLYASPFFVGQLYFETWNISGTVLTVTPNPSWTANTNIAWVVTGQDTNGNMLGGTIFGSFNTSAGGGGGGSGTNKTTTFSLSKVHVYQQSSTNVGTLDTVAPYAFTAAAAIASNRSASSVQLTYPTTVVTNMTPTPGHPESYTAFASSTNLGSFDSNFPSGTYTFVLQPSNSLTGVVNLSPALVQPGIPRLSNYTAAQSINATNSFQLIWDTFPGGTATDFVSVAIGNVFQTGGFGATNALSGTATSVTIPAGTLTTNATYDVSLGFYRGVVNTNNSNYIAIGSLGTITLFTITTIGQTNTNTIMLTNWAVSNGLFSFDVKGATNTTVRVDYNTNLNLTNWTALLTTNTGAGQVRVTDPQAVSNRTRMYRGHVGP